WNKFSDDHEAVSALKVADIDGQLVTLDGRRLLVAQNAELKFVPILIVQLDDRRTGTNHTWRKAFEK
ncbi:unnamed protein product, partial [Didymodactylos carnosus]